MIVQNGKLQLPPEFLRMNKRLLIESNEQVFEKNTKCPNCSSVVTISEAFTKSCALDNGITVPAFDEDGVMIGECSKCNKNFAVDVINPEFSEFSNGATKTDYYFNNDETGKEELYKNLLNTTTSVEGDNKLKQYYLNYIYDDYPLYVCNQCGENLERLSLGVFEEKFDLFQKEYYNYVNWSLKNSRGQSPEHIIVKLGFKCSCGNECKSFFFKKYAETVNVEIGDFSICNILGASDVDNRITSGVYSKNNSVSWLYKLIPRWTLLFEKVYIITPFVGHQWLKSAELMDTWLELINRLDHKKSKILLKYGQFLSFRKAYLKENNIPYETLSEFELGSDLLSELKQTNDFHAKIYCGISRERCEVFSGSANLVKGKSMEVMHFNIFADFDKFNDAFLKPLGIKEDLQLKTRSHSLLFDSEKKFSAFLGNGTISSEEYSHVILLDSLNT
ncbi:hypothetical protein GRJ22_03135 [Photobacterium carnosum]|uniref:hypothetical protein n=1 Tax=Photobacterium carnosum TaxID=2023717 RepID=UPI001E30BAE2|nr:hypothetical protein [Photobacterium carnosum]MCD9544837.1 hypothetical protein [Photobacterium carnosum]MCD9555444.1 hypothetical protein [Photobacterium carnosum]